MPDQNPNDVNQALTREVVVNRLAGVIESTHKTDRSTAATIAARWADMYSLGTNPDGSPALVAKSGVPLEADIDARFQDPTYRPFSRKPQPTVADRLVEWHKATGGSRHGDNRFGEGLL